MSIYSRVYGRKNNENTPAQNQVKNDAKSATRVLAGMKVHNSHMKRLDIDGDIFDVPKIEYVHLLDKQVKDLKEENRVLQSKVSRMENAINRTYNELRDLKANSVQKPRFRKVKKDQ